MDLENKKQQQDKEEDALLAEEEAIPEQKQYFRVAEVLADSTIALENFWHATVRTLSSIDEQHALSTTAWNKGQEITNKALENPYLSAAVTKVSDGITMANTIYAQTVELIEEKRRNLSIAASELVFDHPPATSQTDEASTLIGVHDNDDDHPTGVLTPSEPLELQVNPDH